MIISSKHFPIVCIGGSVGSLKAYIRLLHYVSPNMDMAFVLVNHMRRASTQLQKILPRYTSMPVNLITDGIAIEPNKVFIIPSNRDLHVFKGAFRLLPLSKPQGWPNVITVFLESLTRNWEGKLIAIIVSGLDVDGAAALRDVKKVGGVTIAQRLDTADHPDMPKSAIESGFIDFELSPEDIALKLLQLCPKDKQ